MKKVAISRVDKILRQEITTVSTAEKKNSSVFLRGFENALTGYVCVLCVCMCIHVFSLSYVSLRLFIIENIIFIEQSSMKIHF